MQLSRRNSIYENLAIATNVIRGSSCIYPRLARQPMVEEELLSGPLDPINEWYAVAKIAGVKLCQAYRCQYDADFLSAMPTNVFGPGDNYHPDTVMSSPLSFGAFTRRRSPRAGGGRMGHRHAQARVHLCR